MNSYLNRIALALLLAMGVAATTRADEAQDIIDRYIKAVGGEKALRSVKTRVTSGKMLMGPVNADITIYQKQPDLFRMDIKMGQFGETRLGYDGKRGWQKTPQGVTDLPKGQLDQQIRDMSLLRELELEKFFSARKAVPGREFDGRKTDGLELTQHDGDKQTWYFDRETHLLIHIDAPAEGPQGKISTSTDMSGYKDFEGIKLPTVSKTKTPMAPIEMNFTSVKHNEKLGIETFQP